jgi:hypothetical protein
MMFVVLIYGYTGWCVGSTVRVQRLAGAIANITRGWAPPALTRKIAPIPRRVSGSDASQYYR